MTWANPWAAWFLLLIPAVILLYFLKLRRTDTVVSSTLLWSRALVDRRANAPFQRLRRNLLLLLQILAILVLVGVLGRPERQSTLEWGRTHLVLVDVSASMAAREDGGTRLDLARSAARDYLRQVPRGERAVLIAAGRRAQALTAVTDDLALVVDGLERLRILPGEGVLDDAMRLALSLSGPALERDAVAVLFSDGGLPAWDDADVPLPIDYHVIGTPRENAGLVALASRMDHTGSGRPQVFVELRHHGTQPASGVVSIRQDGALVRAAAVEVEAGGRWSQSFEALGGASLVEVAWEPAGPDALALDDRAWLALQERPDLHVWLVGEPNFLLESGLALPLVRLRKLAADELAPVLAAADRPPDVIVWDRHAPTALPEGVGAHLLFGALPPEVWTPPPPLVEFPPIVTWDRRHPVNRFLSYGRVVVGEGRVLPHVPGVTPLVESRGGALIALFQSPRQRGLVVGFDLLQSTWPTDLSFSLFLHNALGYLAGTEFSVENVVRAGELLTLQAPAVRGGFRLERPDGQRFEQAAEADGWLRSTATDALGPYRVFWQEPDAQGVLREREHVLCVNLLSPAETDLTPRDTIEVSGQALAAGVPQRGVTVQDVWPWVLALALGLLLLEWRYYHRR